MCESLSENVIVLRFLRPTAHDKQHPRYFTFVGYDEKDASNATVLQTESPDQFADYKERKPADHRSVFSLKLDKQCKKYNLLVF